VKRFLLYSQEGEDWILYSALKHVDKGFYIDVGANDPWDISVTKFFYERGWSGINIEPLVEEYDLLCEDRPRDINLNMGAGNIDGEMKFYVMGTGTTCDVDTVNDPEWTTYKERESLITRTIPVKRLSNIINELVKEKNQEIHFCKIDVEGFERNVLEGIDFNRHRPWIMVLESAFPGSNRRLCHDKWEDVLATNGYELAFVAGINRYYVDLKASSQYETLKANFNSIDLENPDAQLFRVTKYEAQPCPEESSFKKFLRKLLMAIWRKIP